MTPKYFFTDVTDESLEALVSYIYSGQLKVSSDNVNAVLTSAEMFGILSAVELCHNFIHETSNACLNKSDMDVYDEAQKDSDNLTTEILSVAPIQVYVYVYMFMCMFLCIFLFQ